MTSHVTIDIVTITGLEMEKLSTAHIRAQQVSLNRPIHTLSL